jgi:hypothetical protein
MAHQRRAVFAAMRATRIIPLLIPLALAACGGGAPRIANRPLQPGGGTYIAPGPAGDPWGPYIREASGRFNVPEKWIRAVMHQESGGQEYLNGEPITSSAGAMGLMQLMPATYADMRDRYALGNDPYEPHDNIMAGTAYISLLYAAYGSPAFLAAYNAGPNRLADYLANHRALPDETRRYVWLIGSQISGIYPQSRSPNEQVALNQIPVAIPPGLRHYVRHVYAQARTRHHGHEAPVRFAALQRHKTSRAVTTQAPIEVAEAPEPKSSLTHLAAAAPVRTHGGLHLITSAYAAENLKIGGKNWAVQVGAFPSRAKATAAATTAGGMVAHSGTAVAVQSGHATVYRARLSGLTHDAAVHACQKLAHKSGGCLIVSPASQ